jgi:hypothetical protein
MGGSPAPPHRDGCLDRPVADDGGSDGHAAFGNSRKGIGSGGVSQRGQRSPHDEDLGLDDGCALRIAYMPFHPAGGRNPGNRSCASGGNGEKQKQREARHTPDTRPNRESHRELRMQRIASGRRGVAGRDVFWRCRRKLDSHSGRASGDLIYSVPRFTRKKRFSRSPHSSAIKPPTTSGRWFVRGLRRRSYTEPAIPQRES